MNQIGKILQAIACWIKINQKEILGFLSDIALWSRALILTTFIISINLVLYCDKFEMEDIFYRLGPLFFTSLVLHFIYYGIYFLFSKM
jgi:hypothetical protein